MIYFENDFDIFGYDQIQINSEFKNKNHNKFLKKVNDASNKNNLKSFRIQTLNEIYKMLKLKINLLKKILKK